MHLLPKLLVGVVALIHVYFLWLEMFGWTTKGREKFQSKTFSAELFEPTKPLAANQGLSNGFLAAGLIWSLLIDDATCGLKVGYFFLVCIIVAGIFGAWTVKPIIFFVQALPAILTLLAVVYL